MKNEDATPLSYSGDGGLATEAWIAGAIGLGLGKKRGHVFILDTK